MRRVLYFVLGLSIILFAEVFPLPAQNTEDQEIHESVNVELVDLYLTATDKKGHFITDLQAGDLIVQEDHVPQSILRFGPFAGQNNEAPLILALVIDNSASMDEEIQEVKKLDLARETGLQLLSELGPLDQMMLVKFHERIDSTPLTSDKEVITGALQQMRPNWRQTALFDTLAATIRDLQVEPGRKVLFLCSDGQDNMSKTKLDEVIDLVSNTPELTIVVLGNVPTDVKRGYYPTIQKKPPERFRRGAEILKDLAQRTAGYAFFPENLKEIEKARVLIRSFIRSQYFLAYRSSNNSANGAWRNIQISCKRNGVTLRYRPGYYAQKSS